MTQLCSKQMYVVDKKFVFPTKEGVKRDESEVRGYEKRYSQWFMYPHSHLSIKLFLSWSYNSEKVTRNGNSEPIFTQSTRVVVMFPFFNKISKGI